MAKLKMVWSSLLAPVMMLAACVASSAQAPAYNIGKTPTADEIRAWDITVNTEGKELPPGSGTPDQGAKLYLMKGCIGCHGPNGRGGLAPHLVKSKEQTNYRDARAAVFPFASELWDFINRAMPLPQGGSLKPDEVYSLVAFLLYKNDIIQENDLIDAQTLPKVKMPNRDSFIPPDISGYNPRSPKSSFTVSSETAAKKK